MVQRTRATIDDLFTVRGKAELVHGEVVEMAPTGGIPGHAAGEVFASLRAYSRRTGTGWAITDNQAFRVHLPNRESFSPDAAFWTGPPPTMKYYDGAPAFAVEVRSEGDYGRQAEEAMAAKRADYFAAGTLVVWDVDLLAPDVVRVYRHDRLAEPTIYRRGEAAEAEPAVPGWRMPVDDLFLPDA